MTSYKNVYEPVFVVKIRGTLVTTIHGPGEMGVTGGADVVDITPFVTSFAFADSAEEMDECSITMSNQDGKYTDHELFQEGYELVCLWGYVNDFSPQKIMTIKSIAYTFDQNAPTITIIGFDKAHDLAQKTRQETHRSMSYPDIAKAIAAQFGLDAVVALGNLQKHDQVNQPGLSDITFLKQLGEEIGYECYVQDNELHFHPPNDDGPSAMTFEYFLDKMGMLLSFIPTVDTEGSKSGTEVTADYQDPDEKTQGAEKVNENNADQTKLVDGSTFTLNADGGESAFKPGQTGVNVATAKKSSEEAKTLAQAEKNTRAYEECTATATTIGIPSLVAKSIVTIAGAIGKKFRGNYKVTKCTHTIDTDGYRCDLELKRCGVGLGKGKKGTSNVKAGPTDKALSPKESQVSYEAEGEEEEEE